MRYSRVRTIFRNTLSCRGIYDFSFETETLFEVLSKLMFRKILRCPWEKIYSFPQKRGNRYGVNIPEERSTCVHNGCTIGCCAQRRSLYEYHVHQRLAHNWNIRTWLGGQDHRTGSGSQEQIHSCCIVRREKLCWLLSKCMENLRVLKRIIMFDSTIQ